jgi:hypothetical protein
MLLCDVNVLVYAYREDLERHHEYATWLDEIVNGARPFGVSDLVLSGFVRVVTHPRVLQPPAVPNPLLRSWTRSGLRRMPLGSRRAVVTGGSSRTWCAIAVPGATWCRTPTWPRSRSNRTASGSRPIATTRASPGCAGVTLWRLREQPPASRTLRRLHGSGAVVRSWGLRMESAGHLQRADRGTRDRPCAGAIRTLRNLAAVRVSADALVDHFGSGEELLVSRPAVVEGRRCLAAVRQRVRLRPLLVPVVAMPRWP